jgi:hypothetical protein
MTQSGHREPTAPPTWYANLRQCDALSERAAMRRREFITLIGGGGMAYRGACAAGGNAGDRVP